MSDFSPFQSPYQDIEGASLEELKDECQVWRNTWSWIPLNLKEALKDIGKLYRITLRTNRSFVGELEIGSWKQEEIHLVAFTREMDYQTGKYRTEVVQLRVAPGSIGHIEEIREQEWESNDDVEDEYDINKMTADDVLGTRP